MKKGEAIAKLSNTKVYVDGKSEEIQKKLFELGFRWINEEKGVVEFTDKPFLFMNECMLFGHDNDMVYFTRHDYKEIKADEILSITIDKEYDFKPFDRVLVRDINNADWKVDFFSNIIKDKEGYVFMTISACWRQCIPFEGNEHLVGTNNSPDNI